MKEYFNDYYRKKELYRIKLGLEQIVENPILVLMFIPLFMIVHLLISKKDYFIFSINSYKSLTQIYTTLYWMILIIIVVVYIY